MAHPLEVDAEEVSRLSDTQFQRLLNRMLEIEVSLVGLPDNALGASDEVDVADGGIDARIHAPGFGGSEFLPPGSSIWQAKSGSSGWPDYAKELAKDDVREAILQGQAYVMLLGRELTFTQNKTQSGRLRVEIDKIKSGAPFDLRSAARTANWATRYPAIWRHFGRTPGGFWDVRDFLNQQPVHGAVYVRSPEADSARDAIRARLADLGSSAHLRVHGRAGVGKSRFVLETFSGEDDVALYAPYASEVDKTVLRWICDRPGVTATLVVDECDASEARQLAMYVRSAKGVVNLVTIGPDPAPEPEDQFQIDPVSDDVLRAVVEGTYSQIPLEQLLWIVEKTRGFVKLARRLAEVARKSRVNLTTLDVPGLLGELFSPEEQAALTVAELCTHVGWDGEVEVEGRTLSEYMGIEWRTCKRVVRSLEERGYVGRAGRYRYITPELLAIWLAAQEWATNRTSLEAVFANATTHMADRMSNRLRQMPQIDDVVDLASEVLGPGGAFRDLAALNHPRTARFFGDFSRIVPDAAARSLERIFDGLDAPSLRTLDAGRREVVWMLERLVAHRHLFHATARLLLRLAVAENEQFANNATGVFHSLFSPSGRKTAAIGEERLDLLSEVIDAGDQAELLVALGAFEHIFDAHGGYAVSADPGGLPPPSPWWPASREEYVEYCRRALALFESLLDHGTREVRNGAESMLLAQFRSLFWLGLGDEALEIAYRSDLSENVQRRLVINADEVLVYDHDKPFMTQGLLEGLRRLTKKIYADPLRERLHLRLGSWNRDLMRATRESSESFVEVEAREIKSLVDALLLEPATLREEFDWITSEEAVKGHQFLSYLGERDKDREWLAPVWEASKERNKPGLISSYVFGLSRSSSGSDVETLLDEWAIDDGTRPYIPHITGGLGLSERRVARLLELVAAGLDPKALICLTWSQLESDLTLETLATLLRTMTSAGSAARSAVWTILSNDLRPRPDSKEMLSQSELDLRWELAGNADFIGDFVDGQASYSWAECVKPLVSADAKRLVEAIVSAVQSEREHLYKSSYTRKVLDDCFAADPHDSWQAYAAGIRGTSLSSWVLTNRGAETGITEMVGVEYLKSWVGELDEEGEGRVKLIAKLTTVDTQLTPVIRWMVTEYGDSEETLGELMTQYGTRTIVGGMAQAEQPRLDAARKWTRDSDRRIRQWARRLAADLERRIERYRIEDEESELGR